MLIEINPSDKDPRTHVLIIGVGYYPHFAKGPEPVKPSVHSLAHELTSVPSSTEQFASWIFSPAFRPRIPLGTVDLLLSQKNPTPFRNVPGGEPQRVPDQATFDNMKRAIRDWESRCKSCANNQAIFYYCGHGLEVPERLALLASDFPETTRPYDKSIDFKNIFQGMGSSNVNNQWFFVDACREAPTGNLDGNYDFDPIKILRQTTINTKGSIIYSTFPTESSQGIPGDSTIFTKALLKCMKRGWGSEKDVNGRWVVTLGSLSRQLYALMTGNGGWDLGLIQRPEFVRLKLETVIHELETTPALPVEIRCKPRAANSSADFFLRQKHTKREVDRRLVQDPRPWRLEVASDKYYAHADFVNTPLYKNQKNEFWIQQAFDQCQIDVE